MYSPIGDIARSAPTLNKPIPKISKRAQTTNITISSEVRCTSGVAHKISTIATTGSTDTSASFILLHKIPIKPIFSDYNIYILTKKVIFCNPYKLFWQNCGTKYADVFRLFTRKFNHFVGSVFAVRPQPQMLRLKKFTTKTIPSHSDTIPFEQSIKCDCVLLPAHRLLSKKARTAVRALLRQCPKCARHYRSNIILQEVFFFVKIFQKNSSKMFL